MNPSILIVLLILLVGCGGSTSESDDSSVAESPASHRLSAQEQALERARNVEQDVLEAADRQRQAIDDQEDGG